MFKFFRGQSCSNYPHKVQIQFEPESAEILDLTKGLILIEFHRFMDINGQKIVGNNL